MPRRYPPEVRRQVFDLERKSTQFSIAQGQSFLGQRIGQLIPGQVRRGWAVRILPDESQHRPFHILATDVLPRHIAEPSPDAAAGRVQATPVGKLHEQTTRNSERLVITSG